MTLSISKLLQKISATPHEWLLYGVLAFALLVRLAGVGYGLPLAVIGDEYPFTYSALQMIQSQTLVPAADPESFKNILPYPPYLSYVLLPFFSVMLLAKYLLFHGPMELFMAAVVSDLSAFFIVARLINVALGTISVYLAYQAAHRWFRSHVAALASAFLLATSLLHIALSMVGRNWLPASFVFLLVLYVLTMPGWTRARRYIIASVLTGLGMGVSTFCAFAAVMVAIHYLCFDLRDKIQLRRDVPLIAVSAVSFAWLAVIPMLLWHNGNVFLGAVSAHASKTLAGLLASPWSLLTQFTRTESILIALFACGLLLALVARRRIGVFALAWLLAYAACFYFLFRFEPRFFLPLVPLMAIIGGYCVSRLWTRPLLIALVCAALFIPLLSSVRLAQLAWQGDTRDHAREWVLTHLTPDDKILVFATATTIPTQAAAVDELRSLDARTLRKIDLAYETLDMQYLPYVVNNLTSFGEIEPAQELARRAWRGEYEYMLFEPMSLPGIHAMNDAFFPILHDAEIVQQFDGFGDHMSLSQSAFTEPLFTLFSPKSLGPDIVIVRIATTTEP